MRKNLVTGALASLVLSFNVAASGEEALAQPRILSPADGATVQSPVKVLFGLSGLGVAPAGVNIPSTGHHHLIIDAPLPPADQPIPKDEHYRHYGGGQTEAEIELAPGRHTLQLLLGDFAHVPHSMAQASQVITITVEAP